MNNYRSLLVSGACLASAVTGYWLTSYPIYVFVALAGLAILAGMYKSPVVWLMLLILLTTVRLIDNQWGFWSISKILTICMLGVLMLKYSLKKTGIHVFRELALPLSLFALWSIFSALWARDAAAALGDIISLLSLLALFFLIYALFRNQPRIFSIATYVTILALALSSLVGLYALLVDRSFGQQWGLQPLSYIAYGARVSGLNGDANGFALMLNYACLLCISLLVGNAKKSAPFLSVPFLLGLIGLFAFILINTFSRSAWGGFIVGGIYLVFSPGFVRKRYLALIMIATLILVSTYMPVILNRVETLEDTEYGGRLPEIETGLRYFSDAPLNGIGIGNYKPTILEERLAMRQYIAPGAAHNVFVKTLAETGLVGTLLYLWVWFVLLRLALRNERLAPTKELYWANRGFVACLLATLVSSFSQGTLYFNLWWVMLGLFAVLSDFIGQVSATGKKSEAKPVVGVLIREYPA